MDSQGINPKTFISYAAPNLMGSFAGGDVQNGDDNDLWASSSGKLTSEATGEEGGFITQDTNETGFVVSSPVEEAGEVVSSPVEESGEVISAALEEAGEGDPYKGVLPVGEKCTSADQADYQVYVGITNALKEMFGEDLDMTDVKMTEWQTPEKGLNRTYEYTDKNGMLHRVNYEIGKHSFKETSKVDQMGAGSDTFARTRTDASGEKTYTYFITDENGNEQKEMSLEEFKALNGFGDSNVSTKALGEEGGGQVGIEPPDILNGYQGVIASNDRWDGNGTALGVIDSLNDAFAKTVGEDVDMSKVKMTEWQTPQKGFNRTYEYIDSKGRLIRVNYELGNHSFKETSRVAQPFSDINAFIRVQTDANGEETYSYFQTDEQGGEKAMSVSEFSKYMQEHGYTYLQPGW